MDREKIKYHNISMNKIIIRFPLYLGIVVLIISVLAATIKIGERNILLNNRIAARGAEVNLTLNFSLPNIIVVNFISKTEVKGADISMSYNNKEIEILPSTLQGMSGFITTGGEVDQERGVFTFSAVTDKPIKTGILAFFRVRNKIADYEGDIDKVKVDYSKTETRIFGVDMGNLPLTFSGLDYK